jgi:Uma2 family endonuclease
MINIENHIPVSFQLERKYRTYTLEEFLRKEAKSLHKHEFFQGKITKMPYAKGPHNIIAANISGEMYLMFRETEKNYLLFNSDQMIYLPAIDAGVYADALAVCEKPKYWDDNELLLINPILVVEVLSKSTSNYDKFAKFEKYKTLESFREYILIAQDRCYVEVRYQVKKGLWQETVYENIDDKINLQSIDIQIDMKYIYRNIDLKTAI